MALNTFCMPQKSPLDESNGLDVCEVLGLTQTVHPRLLPSYQLKRVVKPSLVP